MGGHPRRHAASCSAGDRRRLAEPETFAIGRPVGAVAPALGGGYVLAAAQGFLFLDESGAITELATATSRGEVRMNDGACDPQGRFWAGTMAYDESPGAGSLYRLELDGRCTTVLTGLTISNGIGWSPDGTTMYLNDSGIGCLDVFDFEGATGSISGRRTLWCSADPPSCRTASRSTRTERSGSRYGKAGWSIDTRPTARCCRA